jgi:hypothetical protein
MSWVAVAGVAVTAVSGAVQADGARKAAHKQQDAAARAEQTQLDMQKPALEARDWSLGELRDGLQAGGRFNQPFTMADATNSEAEQHALKQGTQAIENSAASRGGLLGTNTLHDLTKFSQGNAAQFQNQAFNQWLAERQQSLAPLQSMAQLGQTAVTGVADNVSNLQLASGNASAAGIIGQNKAYQNTGDQISMLAGLFGTKGGSTGGGSAPAGGYGAGMDTSSFSGNTNYSLSGP